MIAALIDYCIKLINKLKFCDLYHRIFFSALIQSIIYSLVTKHSELTMKEKESGL